MKNIAVYGAGGWGTALACQVARKNGRCILLARDINVINDINNNRLNSKHLGNKILNKYITATHDISVLKEQQIVVVAVPSISIKETIRLFKDEGLNKDTILLIATKGLISNPAMMISTYLKELISNQTAFVSGPNFAAEVVDNLETYATIAADNIELAQILTENLSSRNFMISPCNDIITIQIAGAVKNVIAIQSGIYQAKIEANIIGENAKAALITQGLQEIDKIAQFFGGKTKSLQEVGVIGDLILSCSSLKSRNAKFGYQFFRAANKKEFIQNYSVLVEGLNQAKLLKELIIKFNFSLPTISSIIETLDL